MPDTTTTPDWTTGNTMAGATMGLGGIADIFSLIQNQRQSDRQRQLYELLQNPQALAAHINAMVQPLSQAGQEHVSRMVQGEMAMRGTADSRYADLASARAFSDDETSRRNTIMQYYMQALGQSAGLTGARSPIGGLAGAMQQIMRLRGMGRPNEPGIAANPAAPTSGWSPYGNLDQLPPSLTPTPMPGQSYQS